MRMTHLSLGALSGTLHRTSILLAAGVLLVCGGNAGEVSLWYFFLRGWGLLLAMRQHIDQFPERIPDVETPYAPGFLDGTVFERDVHLFHT